MSQVSVIVPTFNRAEIFERALNSVLRQTYTDWELILVDDGSTDATAAVFNRWRTENPTPRVRYIRSENRGVSAARNLGLQLSQSAWLAFLDSDDEWLSDKLARQMELTERFVLIHGEEIWIRRGVRVNPMKKYRKMGGRIFSRCVDLCFVSPSTAMVRRDVLQAAGGFREDFPVCEDYELWLRLSARHDAGFVAAPVTTKYGGHADQLSRRHHSMDYYRVKALVPFLEERDEISPAERVHVAQTVIYKSDILLNGYDKHGQRENVAEVCSYRECALSSLTQYHNAHSAAERFPRSVSTLTL